MYKEPSNLNKSKQASSFLIGQIIVIDISTKTYAWQTKHVKRGSTRLAIRKMQIKTKIRFTNLLEWHPSPQKEEIRGKKKRERERDRYWRVCGVYLLPRIVTAIYHKLGSLQHRNLFSKSLEARSPKSRGEQTHASWRLSERTFHCLSLCSCQLLVFLGLWLHHSSLYLLPSL